MSFRPENGNRDDPQSGPPQSGSSGGPPDERSPEMRESPEEEGRRGGLSGRPDRGLVPLVVVGLLLLALVIGGILLWLSYGDRAGGASVYEDSIESGPEPALRLLNGLGRVRVEGVEGQESVEISARRYARGRNPAAAKENAADVPVNVASEGSTIEISSDGGRGTGVDYDLRVPPGSTVEVDSEAGDVEVSGLDNTVTVLARSGDVSVEDIQGSIGIESQAGDVTVGSVSTETGNAEINVGSGDLELTDLVVGILEAHVEAGDVALLGRFSGSGSISVETGSIDVRLPSEDAKDLVFEARVGQVSRDDEQEPE
ncbi:MAG TPA: DUF4097 family beta strand repeat-containing protein [Rubrobacter sp.]|nr:DUF4097 family beta strand repeat-containing protein [Rubrobacter sp.]